MKDERTTSNAPKGNCLAPVIYVAGSLGSAGARLQQTWTGCALAEAAGVKRETRVTFAGGGREGVGWTEEMSF